MKKLIIFFFTIIALGSCQDDFLDKKPLDAVSDEDVWSDIYLAEAFLNNIYSVRGYDGYSRRHETWCYGCFMLDAGSDDGKNSFTWTEAEKLNLNTFTTEDAPLANTWADMYRQIRNTNLFLSRIDNVANGEASAKDILKGEAKFLRAFFYFELMKQYGGVPLITTPQELTGELNVPRSTYDESADFVTKELDEAAALLPVNATQTGRASKGAALALKGRVLLYWASPLNNPGNDKSRWEKSAAASQEVISLGKYSLFPNYATLFQPENENNVEVIFDKQYIYPVRPHFHNTFHTPYSKSQFQSGWGGTNATQEFVDSYEMEDGLSITESPLYSENDPYKDRDPRFYATVLFDEAKFTIGGVERTIETRTEGDNGIGQNQDATKTGYYIGKFLDKKYAVTYARSGGEDSEQNWIFIRYAEVLLNYAEARNEAVGPDESVYSAVNEVRKRVNMPALPGGLSYTQMRDRIRNERRVELAFEEHRFWDIRRWKIAEQVLNGPVHGMQITKDAGGTRTFNRFPVETRNFTNRNYVFPIKQSEVTKSTGLLEQNPGW